MKKPWQIHPDLTAERLGIVAELLSGVRNQAITEHAPPRGDTNWGLGCRVYERSMFAVEQAVSDHAFLGVVDKQGLHFVFSIGVVPVRFYRGDHEDEADPRRLRRHDPELHAQQVAFDFVPEPKAEAALRLIVETDDAGRATEIFIVQFGEDGKPYNPWSIPFNRTMVAIDEFRKEGVPLQAPTVGELSPSTASEDGELKKTDEKN